MGTFHLLYAQVLTHKWLSGDDTQGAGHQVLHQACCRFGLGVIVRDQTGSSAVPFLLVLNKPHTAQYSALSQASETRQKPVRR